VVPQESSTDFGRFADAFEDAVKGGRRHGPQCQLCSQFAPEAHRIAEFLDNSDSARSSVARRCRELMVLLGETGADQRRSNATPPIPPRESCPTEPAPTASMFQEASNVTVDKSNFVNVNGNWSSGVHNNSTNVLIIPNHPGLTFRAGRNAD